MFSRQTRVPSQTDILALVTCPAGPRILHGIVYLSLTATGSRPMYRLLWEKSSGQTLILVSQGRVRLYRETIEGGLCLPEKELQDPDRTKHLVDRRKAAPHVLW